MAIETEFTNALVTIASGLGLATEQIFGVFVGAQPMLGAMNIASLAIAFGIAYIVGKFAYKTMMPSFKDSDGDWDNDESPIVLALTSMLVGFTALMIVDMYLSVISPSIMQIMYPEYAATKEIIELVMP